jgi:Tfp pilus assembly protein PilF
MMAGDWYLRAGMPDEAEKYYKQALQLDPVRPGAFARLAKIELQRGNEAKAVELHNTAHRIFPKSRFYKPERLYQEP